MLNIVFVHLFPHISNETFKLYLERGGGGYIVSFTCANSHVSYNFLSLFTFVLVADPCHLSASKPLRCFSGGFQLKQSQLPHSPSHTTMASRHTPPLSSPALPTPAPGFPGGLKHHQGSTVISVTVIHKQPESCRLFHLIYTRY